MWLNWNEVKYKYTDMKKKKKYVSFILSHKPSQVNITHDLKEIWGRKDVFRIFFILMNEMVDFEIVNNL